MSPLPTYKKLVLACFIAFLLFSLTFFTILAHAIHYEDAHHSHSTSEDSFLLSFNKTKAYDYIVNQLDFGFRVPGTVEHDLCSLWIQNQLQDIVDIVKVHNFTIQKENQPSYACQNILGKINPNKANITILAAHWDTRNVAEKDVYNRSTPIPGANDGGSGVAVLLELARVLSSYKDELDSQIWFLFFDAEDQGYSRNMYGLQGWDWCEGSKAFANQIDLFYDSSEQRFDSFILLDMVGGTNLQFIRESRNNEELYQAIFEEGRSLGYETAFPLSPKRMGIIDDHVSFHELGLPVVDLIIDFVDGPWTYHHTHADNLTNIDINSLMITGKTIESFVKRYYSLNNEDFWQEDPGKTHVPFIVMSIMILSLIPLVRKSVSKRREKKF